MTDDVDKDVRQRVVEYIDRAKAEGHTIKVSLPMINVIGNVLYYCSSGN